VVDAWLRRRPKGRRVIISFVHFKGKRLREMLAYGSGQPTFVDGV